MADFSDDFIKDISVFLISLKLSIDRPSRRRLTGHPIEVESFTQALLAIEEARIRFDFLQRRNVGGSSKLYEEARREMSDFVERLLRSVDLEPWLYDSAFRISMPARERASQSAFFRHLEIIRPSIPVALIEFREYVDRYGDKPYPMQQALEFGTLERIIPKQQVAPVQFEVVDGIVRVIHNPPRKLDVDRKNISSALDHILGKGERLLESLEKSNCDRRLLDSVSTAEQKSAMGRRKTRPSCYMPGGVA